jgi:hypothetical protein
MPRARRRRNRPASRRSWLRIVLWVVVVALAGVVVVGSVAEINAQSGGYRASTNTGFAKLATRVVDASNRTGSRLATLINKAATLVNKSSLVGREDNTTGASARAILQQGLDQAADDSDQQARQASNLVPPTPTGGISTGLSAVMARRAAAVAAMRATIDRQLGMSPLPIAGAPPSTTAVSTAPLLSIGEASQDLAGVGRTLEGADRSYRALTAAAKHQPVAIELPRSVWVTRPEDASPLGSTRLAQLPPALASPAAAALVPFHQVVITATGLSPPAVASGGPGTIGTGCGTQAQSTVPGSTPTILPPTSTVTALATVTNCGTVDESGITVSQTLALADPAGTALPPADARGGRSHTVLSIRSGTSRALTLSPMRVDGGHFYSLDVSITIPASQKSNPDGTRGTSQQFLLQISP